MNLGKNKSIIMSYLGVQDRFQIQMRSMEEFIENVAAKQHRRQAHHREIKTKRLSIDAGCLF